MYRFIYKRAPMNERDGGAQMGQVPAEDGADLFSAWIDATPDGRATIHALFVEHPSPTQEPRLEAVA